jgi:hypothetical protein
MEYKLTFEQYQQGLAEDKFLGLRCNACQAVTFPPLAICRNCSGTDLKVTEIGRGDPSDLYGDPGGAPGQKATLRRGHGGTE